MKKVLVLDTAVKLEEFRKLIGEVEDIRFSYTENLHQAMRCIKEEDIEVLLLGSDINGFAAELLPIKIKQEMGKEIEVILNCFKQDTCRINKDFYLKSNLIDIIYPTIDRNKIIRKIKVAIEARNMNKINFLEESEA